MTDEERHEEILKKLEKLDDAVHRLGVAMVMGLGEIKAAIQQISGSNERRGGNPKS